MHSILNIWLILFWFSVLIFFLNTNNIIKLFISSEIIWILLYGYSLIVGVYLDEVHIYMLSLLLISIASVEFSIGFILIIFFKKIFKVENILDTTNSDWSTIDKFNKH